MLIDTRCVFCAKPVSGEGMINLDHTSNLENAWHQSLGQICMNCQSVSCHECSKRGIDINSLDEISRAKCLKCGETNHSKVALVASEFPQPSSVEEKASSVVGVPDWIIGASAAGIFLLLGGAPFTDGRQAWIDWLGDGGFIVLGGAVILGYLSPKFMGKK